MQVGLHALGWGLSRFAALVVVVVVGACLAYMALVFGIVVVQAAQALGQ
jgi:hypothetical protein